MKNKYINKQIDASKYSTIRINAENPAILNQQEIENGEPGYINAPFVLAEHSKESLRDYKKFINKYHKLHELCPKCGHKAHSVTLMGYILNSDKKEEYKDFNDCVCANCGNRHKVHERMSSRKLLIEKFIK